MNKTILTAILAVIASVSVAVAAEPTNNAPKPSPMRLNRSVMPEPTLRIGDAAPALVPGKWIKGEPVKGFEKGKVYVVEFWATWCPPCLMSIPHLTKLQEKHKDVVIIGQNCSEPDQAKVEAFVKKMGDKMNYRVALDDTSKDEIGAMNKNWMIASAARGIPTAFIVDKNSKLVWKGHPMQMDRILPAIIDGTFDTKKEAEFQTKMEELQLEYVKAIRADDVDKAFAALEEMKKLDPAGAKDRELNKAYVLITRKKDYAAGQELMAKLADTEFKDNGGALMSIASVISSIKEEGKANLDLALRLAQRAVELNGAADPGSQQILAQVYAAKGDYAKAIEAQTKVVDSLEGMSRARAQKALDEYKSKAAPTAKPQS
jgi:thiol-disulfide isomerase/thioredoxin